MIKKVILSLLICLFILIFLELGLHFAGYLYDFKHRDKIKKQLIYSQDKDVVIVCVGDSNTYGSEAEYGYDYPHQLEELLNNTDPYRFIVYNLGVIGQNSSQLKQGLYKNIERYKPDFIVALIGVNNRWNLTDSDYYLTSNLQISSWSKIKTFINNLHTVKLVRISILNFKNKFFLLKLFHHINQTISLKNISNNSNYSIDGNLTLVESYTNQRRYTEALEKIKEIGNVP